MVTPLAFSCAKAANHVVDDRRRQALAGLVDDQQLARLDDRARHRQHLLLPAGQLAGRVVPELFHGGEQREDPLQPRAVDLRGVLGAARGQQHVLLDREVGEDAHVLRHVGYAEAGDLRRGQLRDVLAVKADAALRGAPQAHDRAQRGRLARAVAPRAAW
jgi:hypothetical protein